MIKYAFQTAKLIWKSRQKLAIYPTHFFSSQIHFKIIELKQGINLDTKVVLDACRFILCWTITKYLTVSFILNKTYSKFWSKLLRYDQRETTHQLPSLVQGREMKCEWVVSLWIWRSPLKIKALRVLKMHEWQLYCFLHNSYWESVINLFYENSYVYYTNQRYGH